MRITIERSLDPGAVDAFYRLYRAAFAPLRTNAAARHLLSAEEFAAEMADKRIEKYVAWAGNGEPVGLATLTADLSAVPWISPEYYGARYPDHLARGALFYLGYTLVRPDHEQRGVFAPPRRPDRPAPERGPGGVRVRRVRAQRRRAPDRPEHRRAQPLPRHAGGHRGRADLLHGRIQRPASRVTGASLRSLRSRGSSALSAAL